MWEHVTPSDRNITLPPSSSQFRIPDRRAVQFWDDQRALSRTMDTELPFDTLKSVAEIDSVSVLAWDCIALYRPGRRWDQVFPVPDWSGRPVSAASETLRVRLRAFEHKAGRDSTR